MVGVLNSDETRAVAILQNKLTNGMVGVVDPLSRKRIIISLTIRNGARPKITADMNGGQPIFNVEVQIDAEISGLSSGINYSLPLPRTVGSTNGQDDRRAR